LKALPNELSPACIEALIKIGIVEPFCLNAEGFKALFVSKLPLFHPKHHIPPTNPSNDMNILSVEGYTFSVCRSMQNLQQLTACNGVNKYVCK
jgi:hypothetical protein